MVRTTRPVIRPGMSVAELLRGHPEAARTFGRHRMACVGCLMSDFDTLADVARSYGLVIPGFLAEVEHDVEAAEASRKTAAPSGRSASPDRAEGRRRQ
jgi:hybrid cluster-associated redox disulfide protein